jgi:uncharacterized protein
MLYEITIPQFLKMLHNLSAILDKAAQFADSKKFEVDVLLQSRLAPDQFNFTRQVQIVCDTAKLCASRLTGKDAPTHPDTEKTLPELKARIESTMAYLQGFSAKDFSEAASRRISQPRWEGQYLTGDEFVTQHAIPNFYFHFTTAYSILRHNGVEVGKKDYLGKMPFKK